MKVVIECSEIVIRLSVEALVTSFDGCPYVQGFDPEEDGVPRISDLDEFAESVVGALQEEREDGSTFLTDAFDNAYKRVVEYGYDGVKA